MNVIIYAVPIVLVVVGAYGIWLARNSPVQLQPFPALFVGVGVVLAALLLTGCTTGPREIETRDVIVTRTERPITEQQVQAAPPPAPLPARPADARTALDLALAQVCAWVAWGEKVDPLLQHSAGITVTRRIAEPACVRER